MIEKNFSGVHNMFDEREVSFKFDIDQLGINRTLQRFHQGARTNPDFDENEQEK